MITVSPREFAAIHAACYAGDALADALAAQVVAHTVQHGGPACRAPAFADYCDRTEVLDN